jgi:tRNA 5-methylaminomethyl-2-thiouridine biosynthesis bifunctional protein
LGVSYQGKFCFAMTKKSGITHAKLEWRNDATPASTAFNDVYFSKLDGAQESEYVFLKHNQLQQRWSQWNKEHFVIAETGFGTGLNFLLTWLAFRQFRQTHPEAKPQRLIFCSVEKFPLTPADLKSALAYWSQLRALSNLLLQQYPTAVPGCHRMEFDDGCVTLDLWLGDVNQLLPHWNRPTDGLVDAWFLDGFAPSKNPDMWSDTLYRQMARLARPGCTFATFTAAGAVRRGLQSVGFKVEKVPGYGSKREMLRGAIEQTSKQPMQTPPRQVTIIGGGIASAALALALVKRRITVTLLCEDPEPAQGASGNRQGALYPLLHVEYDRLSEFFSQAFGFARRQVDQLIRNGHEIAHDWCGVIQLAFNEKSRIRRAKLLEHAEYCQPLVQGASAKEASEMAGVEIPHDVLFYPAGGWLTPPDLVAALLKHTKKTGLLTTHFNQSKTEQGWQLTGKEHLSGEPVQRKCQTLVVANGHRCTDFSQLSDLPITAVRGQVSHVRATERSELLKTVLCYEGYLAPALSEDRHPGFHCLGASFKRNTLSTRISAEEQRENLDKLVRCIAPATWANGMDISDMAARVSFRCGSRDHLPLIGPIHQLSQEQISAMSASQAVHAGYAPPSTPPNCWRPRSAMSLYRQPRPCLKRCIPAAWHCVRRAEIVGSYDAMTYT